MAKAKQQQPAIEVRPAAETLADPHDAAWWKVQWEQLKAENDRPNPELDRLRHELNKLAADRDHLAHKLRQAAQR